MRVAALFLLPALGSAFAPPAHRRPSLMPLKTTAEAAAVTEITDDVNSRIGNLLEKADSLIIRRAMRVVNHAPVIVTLGELTRKLGSSRFGLDIAPSALNIAAPAGLAVPTWAGYVLPILVVSQVAAVAKSALADDRDDLSQEDIAALAVTNVALGRALTDGSALNWAIASIASGYSARNGDAGGDTTIQNLSTQLASSVSTVAAVLGVAAKLPDLIPFLKGQTEVTAIIGLLGYYGLATREGNSQVKKVVNAAVVGGVLLGKIAGGALKMSTNNLISAGTVVTAATAYVAWIAIDKARDALQ